MPYTFSISVVSLVVSWPLNLRMKSNAETWKWLRPLSETAFISNGFNCVAFETQRLVILRIPEQFVVSFRGLYVIGAGCWS